jgi:hypothetical protein
MYIYFIELLVYGQGAGLTIPEKIERIPKIMDLDPKRKRKRSLNNLGFVGNGSGQSERQLCVLEIMVLHEGIVNFFIGFFSFP